MSTHETPTSLQRKIRFLDEHQSVLVLFRWPWFWVWCVVACLPALGAAGYRAFVSFAVGPIVGGTLLAFAFCAIGVQSLFRGRVVTNRGIFVRSSEPIGFWFSLATTILMYCAAILAILKA